MKVVTKCDYFVLIIICSPSVAAICFCTVTLSLTQQAATKESWFCLCEIPEILFLLLLSASASKALIYSALILWSRFDGKLWEVWLCCHWGCFTDNRGLVLPAGEQHLGEAVYPVCYTRFRWRLDRGREFRPLTRHESEAGGVSWHDKVLVGGRVKDAGRRQALGQMIPSAGRRTRVSGLTSSLSKHNEVSPSRSRGHFHPSVRICVVTMWRAGERFKTQQWQTGCAPGVGNLFD